jgi:hypothetical protein
MKKTKVSTGEGFEILCRYGLQTISGSCGVFVTLENRRLACILDTDTKYNYPWLPNDVWNRIQDTIREQNIQQFFQPA